MLAAVTKIESDSHKAALRRLLRKSDVNLQGKVGVSLCDVMDHVILCLQDSQTALMLVSCTGDHVMLQLLLDADADPNIQDTVRMCLSVCVYISSVCMC